MDQGPRIWEVGMWHVADADGVILGIKPLDPGTTQTQCNNGITFLVYLFFPVFCQYKLMEKTRKNKQIIGDRNKQYRELFLLDSRQTGSRRRNIHFNKQELGSHCGALIFGQDVRQTWQTLRACLWLFSSSVSRGTAGYTAATTGCLPCVCSVFPVK